MAIRIRRREFLFTVGSAAAAWPVAADAQQPAVPVIGVLFGGSPTTQRFRLNAIQGGLNAVGFVEGQNVAFEYRWAEGQYDRLPGLAAELAGRRVTVIVAIGNTAALAAKAAITSIPVVFETGIDPVEYSLVASLARPGGIFTGVTFLGPQPPSKAIRGAPRNSVESRGDRLLGKPDQFQRGGHPQGRRKRPPARSGGN